MPKPGAGLPQKLNSGSLGSPIGKRHELNCKSNSFNRRGSVIATVLRSRVFGISTFRLALSVAKIPGCKMPRRVVDHATGRLSQGDFGKGYAKQIGIIRRFF
jgi:hypothetical protein